MKLKIYLGVFIFSIALQTANAQSKKISIAFGSCSDQRKDLSILDTIATIQPDFFIFLGDNVYADTQNKDTLKACYDQLGANQSYQHLQTNTKILATWDDHDYGTNDVGKYHPLKEASKEVFLDFFKEKKHSKRRKHEGIYTSYKYHKNGIKVQLILLDIRTFRSDLTPYTDTQRYDSLYFYHLDYAMTKNADSTLLGQAQWEWLDRELSKKADVRIIASSTQFACAYNGYETWANFPSEQEKMLQLLQKHHILNALFISGDVHYGELSSIKRDSLPPLYDLTASGLTEEWEHQTPNENRIGETVKMNHFGMIEIQKLEKKRFLIELKIMDKQKVLRLNEHFEIDGE